MSIRYVCLCALLLLLVGCSGDIQLDKNNWVCTRVEAKGSNELLITGRTTIPTGRKTNICTRWEML